MIKPSRRIYLASRSPREKGVADQIGVTHEIIGTDVKKSAGKEEPVGGLRYPVARAKAEAAATVVQQPWPVLAADTEVVLDNRIMGKPRDRRAAVDMLMSLSGRTHRVLTAVVLLHDRLECRLSESAVSFRPLTVKECEAYCDVRRPMTRRAVTASRTAPAVFVSRIEGSYSGIMGLPLYETAQLLAGCGQGNTRPGKPA